MMNRGTTIALSSIPVVQRSSIRASERTEPSIMKSFCFSSDGANFTKGMLTYSSSEERSVKIVPR